MTDYLALLLEEQREEERERETAGEWETGSVRVPRPLQGEETQTALEPAGSARLSQPARQPVPTARDVRETGETGPDGVQSDGTDWPVRRWAAGEAEEVPAGVRAAEREGQAALSRQVGTDRLPEALSAAGRTGGTERPGAAAAGGAGWLDHGVRASLAGLPQPEQQPQVVTLEPGTAEQSAQRLELRQLDRLVRRDARRFDGGFQLL